MPTKRLPPRPDLTHLKHQAHDLLRDHRARDRAALQRLREFHPRFHASSDTEIAESELALSDAFLATAREYGFPSWPRLKAHVEGPTSNDDGYVPHHERVTDAVFRRAIDLLDAGDVARLRAHLLNHPDTVKKRLNFEGGNYFRTPTLLQFCAENPIRNGTLPLNIADVARTILDAGGKDDRPSIDETLMLVSSGRIARERGVQVPLIDLLCEYGADPDHAMMPALAHGEFAAADALIRLGATIDLPAAAALGRTRDARNLLPCATAEDRHRALALSAVHGRAEIVALLLDDGEDPNRYNPVGFHAHSTPLHQAAYSGHADVVKLLVERRADLTIRDILYDGTPLDWAEYAGQTSIAAYLRANGALTASELGR